MNGDILTQMSPYQINKTGPQAVTPPAALEPLGLLLLAKVRET